MKPAHHKCPHPECGEEVPNRLFACRAHWFALSLGARMAIINTSNRLILDPVRRTAIRAAGEEWAEIA